MKLPPQRWQIFPENQAKVAELVRITGFFPLITQVIFNRGIETSERVQTYIEPETQQLPSPVAEFPDLENSIDLLQEAIANQETIAICGDYDADGMTSTALLLRALRHLGANLYFEIPDRMTDGYGINTRIVKKMATLGVGLILTVDNGISAHEPIQLAVELGMTVIITDHHDLPPKLPIADAILNPKLLSQTSPYYGLAGVGVAYILAVSLAQKLGKLSGLTEQLLELFTLGTIADLAPLIGVNRRWLKRGLRQLPQSKLAGIQALMQVAGVRDEQKQLKPDDIGFRLGPRINAVGRIGDPKSVIELLTTDDVEIALERATQCEQTNRQRQDLCETIEREAINLIEKKPINWQQDRVLVVLNEGWHHGVIGIVASRLVERYGVPVFIATYEDQETIRGSARGIEEFNVFDALEFCQDLLGKYGGHKAAGGFNLLAQNLSAFQQRLSQFAHRCLETHHLKPLIKIDAEAKFEQLTPQLYQQIDSLQPWGIGNDFPVFWTKNVRVIEQELLKNQYLKCTLQAEDSEIKLKAIAWRWKDYFPLPKKVDIAYKLSENHWNGNTAIELELVGIRFPLEENKIKKAVFDYKGRSYSCSFWESINELRIKNDQGKVLAIQRGQKTGILGKTRETAQPIDVTQPPYYQLIKTAVMSLNL